MLILAANYSAGNPACDAVRDAIEESFEVFDHDFRSLNLIPGYDVLPNMSSGVLPQEIPTLSNPPPTLLVVADRLQDLLRATALPLGFFSTRVLYFSPQSFDASLDQIPSGFFDLIIPAGHGLAELGNIVPPPIEEQFFNNLVFSSERTLAREEVEVLVYPLADADRASLLRSFLESFSMSDGVSLVFVLAQGDGDSSLSALQAVMEGSGFAQSRLPRVSFFLPRTPSRFFSTATLLRNPARDPLASLSIRSLMSRSRIHVIPSVSSRWGSDWNHAGRYADHVLLVDPRGARTIPPIPHKLPMVNDQPLWSSFGSLLKELARSPRRDRPPFQALPERLRSRDYDFAFTLGLV